jgi:hypothetical protein
LNEVFVLDLVFKAGTVQEILDERRAPVVAVGWSGALDEQCLAVWLIDRVVSNARFVNVLDENASQYLGPG